MRISWPALLGRLERMDPLDVGARMVFALFLLSSWVTGEEWFFKFPLRALAIAALALPPLHRDPRLWTAFAALLAAKSIRNWYTQDNHIFLLTWFAVAVVLSLRAADPVRSVGVSARRLIGLSFLFAVVWKGLLSGEFRDGSYFSYTFLTDPRFQGAARLSGVSEDALHRNYAAVRGLEEGTAERAALEGGSARLDRCAAIAAGWTLAIESALALAFLVPESWRRLHRARHVLLLIFGVTTYLVIDIKTYGWTLMALGAAQAESERPRLPLDYLGAGLVVLGYDSYPVLERAAAWITATDP